MPSNTPSIGQVAFEHSRQLCDELWHNLMPDTQAWIQRLCACAIAESDKRRAVQPEQPQQTLTIQDAAETIQSHAKGQGVGIWQKHTVDAKSRGGCERALFIAYADNGSSTPVTAGGETLGDVVANMVNQLTK